MKWGQKLVNSVGTMEFSECDQWNIPIRILIEDPDVSGDKWRLSADNYMPRKGVSAKMAYMYEADTREELTAMIEKVVLPIYQSMMMQWEALVEE